jgi:nucleotide-binding universal stress UspA family protein
MRCILAAVDGSEGAARAVDVAAEFAEKLDLELLLVHVSQEPPVRAAYDIEHLDPGLKALMEAERITPAELYETLAREILDRAKSRAEARRVPRIHTAWRSGDPTETILALAHEREAAFIVVGKRGLGRIRGLLLGSVSQKLVIIAQTPVVVIP